MVLPKISYWALRLGSWLGREEELEGCRGLESYKKQSWDPLWPQRPHLAMENLCGSGGPDWD